MRTLKALNEICLGLIFGGIGFCSIIGILIGFIPNNGNMKLVLEQASYWGVGLIIVGASGSIVTSYFIKRRK